MKNILKIAKEILKETKWSKQVYGKKDDKMKSDVIEFLKKNPDPKDADLHAWAEMKKYDIHEVETKIYELATKFVKFLVGGRANEKSLTEKDVDPAELKKGIEVEAEHIDDVDVQKRISLDHLSEFEDYYTRLDKLESDAKAEDKEVVAKKDLQ